MEIYLTRHGTTKWNEARIMQGWKDSDLTEEGIDHAKKLGMRLSSVDFDIIYSSHQSRALETAKLIRGIRDIEILSHPGLREMSYGRWEGMTLEDINKVYPEELFIYINRPKDYVPVDENGETYVDLIKRVQGFLEDLRRKNLNRVLLVTHGIPLKVLIMISKDLSHEDFAKLPIYKGTALSIIEERDGNFRLLLENDLSHLRP